MNEVITGVDGKFLFPSLPDGKYLIGYYLRRDILHSAFEFSPANVGSDNALDSDAQLSATNWFRIRGS